MLQVERLTFRYPDAGDAASAAPSVDALQDVSFRLRPGSFTVLCGASGCGKTTLLRLLKPALAPHGARGGQILYGGVPLASLEPRTAAAEIAYTAQNPAAQLVTDKVWHELAFGLENLGEDTDAIRRRVGEMASFFGIAGWFRQDTATLSGGQAQLLSLASALVLQPRLLLLDEPTGQLDPIAAAEFLGVLARLNRELGLTVLLAEHRLEDALPLADRVLVLDGGRLLADCPPRELPGALPPGHPVGDALPAAARLSLSLDLPAPHPLTVREARTLLSARFRPAPPDAVPPPDAASTPKAPPLLSLRGLRFGYDRAQPPVVRDASLDVRAGEVFAILGANGAGKTTLLHLCAGLIRPHAGRILLDGRALGRYHPDALYRHNLALLPQEPATLFLRQTVGEDLADIDKHYAESDIFAGLRVEHLRERHPGDLSGGELQACALAKLLLTRPRLLLLDEPTKGLDAAAKRRLAALLRELRGDGGLTLLLVTHDVEFAALTADRCALFFDGELLSTAPAAAFFAQNAFYTTAANRIARHLYPQAVTCEEVAALCRANPL